MPVLASTLALGLSAGCGGSDTSDEESGTPAEAVAEIKEVRALLTSAVDQVREGDPGAAEETVGDAYLEHFEHVEGPLGAKDREFMEELEEAISTELRADIKAGKNADDIEAKVDEIDADLDRAVELLQG
ncbi:MAG TPA: hypothetical protein VM049_02165 [Gaiellaceae bacterium]|nr:hypothetical protein [Gaiellaceae bacterium]